MIWAEPLSKYMTVRDILLDPWLCLFRRNVPFFLGDACNYFTFMFDDYSTTISEYEESLKRLSGELAGKFDTVYLSHGDGNGHKEIMEDVIAVCEDIKAGNTDDIPFSFMGKRALVAKAVTPQMGRRDGGRGNIVYSKDRI